MRVYGGIRCGASVMAVAVASVLLTTNVAAQTSMPEQRSEAETPGDNIIIVTARSREETVIQAPLSITALTAEALEHRHIESMDDLATMTPGLGFEQASSATSSRPVIRGMSQIARTSGDTSNVGVFIDGVYSSGLTGTDLGFDGIERVEVVRGPQAAQYGRNTFAGAINYITKRPGDTFAAGMKAEIGENAAYEIGGYVSAPIVADMVGVRVDVAKGSSGGYFINSVNGERLNKKDDELVRVGVLLKPSPDFNLFISGSYSRDEASPSPLIAIPNSSPRRVGKPVGTARTPNQVGRRVGGLIDDYSEDYSVDPRAFGSKRKSVRLTMIADYDFGGVTLASRTGYEDRDVATLIDLDTTPRGTNFSGNIFTQTATGDLEDRYELSQDLRLYASNPGRFDWTVGGYYSYERVLASNVRFADPALGAGGLTAPAPVNGKASIDQEDRNKSQFSSVYAMASYKFDFGLNLSAEGRYTAERKRVLTIQNNYGSDRLLPLGPELDKTFKYFTPRFIASYQPTRDLNLYISAAKGTKSGGFNPNATVDAEKTFNPEINWTYEVGAKASLFGILQVAASAYYIDWTNQQLTTFATAAASGGDSSITTNIANSEVKGAEIAFDLRPTSWLTLNASYAYTDARYKDAITSNFAGFVDCVQLPRLECLLNPVTRNVETTGRLSGNQLQFSPKHQAALGSEIRFPVAGSWTVFARADLGLSSKKWVDAGNIGYIPGREDLRMRLGVQNDWLKVQGFCSNVTNDKTPITAFSTRDLNGNPNYFVRAREPRQCGASLTLTY